MITTINAATPTVVPAQTFDKWWVQSVVISTIRPGGEAHARVELVKFRTSTEGHVEPSPETVCLEIDNILQQAESDANLAAVVGGLMEYIKGICVARGVAASDSQ